MKFFVSYARQNRLEAQSLVRRIEQLGHESWLDSKLDGGQAWWNEILAAIRDCDAYVLVLSKASIESAACNSERQYAAALGKQVIPIAVAPIRDELLPADVSGLQIIDYSSPSEDAAIELAKSISRLRAAGPPPDPLPDPPEVPKSYLGGLGQRVTAPALTRDEQLSLVADLRHGLLKARSQSDDEDYDTALDLVRMLEERADLYAVTAQQLQALKAEEAERPRPKAQAQEQVQEQPQPDPPPQAPAPQAPPPQPAPPEPAQQIHPPPPQAAQIHPPPPGPSQAAPQWQQPRAAKPKRSKVVIILAVIGGFFVLMIVLAIVGTLMEGTS